VRGSVYTASVEFWQARDLFTPLDRRVQRGTSTEHHTGGRTVNPSKQASSPRYTPSQVVAPINAVR